MHFKRLEIYFEINKYFVGGKFNLCIFSIITRERNV
jgi:hypothetical protein